jgi:hypothetical protein
MRAPLIPLLLAAAGLAGAGCAYAPREESPVAKNDRACANDTSDPLHMISSRPAATRDPEIESLLNQTADPRLAWVNRQMYQTLRSLDVELRREQRVAECEQPSSTPTLQASSTTGAAGSDGANAAATSGTYPVGGTNVGGGTGGVNSGAAGGGAAGASGALGGTVAMAGGPGFSGGATAATNLGGGAAGFSGGVTAATTTAASGAYPAGGTVAGGGAGGVSAGAASGVASGAVRSNLIRKSSLSATGGGGNGATAPKITAGSDNDIVARRLRKAAEQETDPALRAKLWKEYADFRQGMSVK